MFCGALARSVSVMGWRVGESVDADCFGGAAGSNRMSTTGNSL